MSTDVELSTERQRIPGVGASESAALFGLHPYISAFSLFEQLINPQPKTDEEEEADADEKSFGHAIEPYLSDWYARRTQRTILMPPYLVYRLNDKPFIFASPDRFWLKDGEGVLELKSAIHFNSTEELPEHWQIQVQQQMLCADKPLASFAILGGYRRRYLVNDIAANTEFQAILIETIERFMYAVQKAEWSKFGADIDSSHATSEALRRLYKNDTAETIKLSLEHLTQIRGWLSTKEQIAALQQREAILNNQLRYEMKTAAIGDLPDGSQLRRINVKGSTYQVTKEPSWYLKHVKTSKGNLS